MTEGHLLIVFLPDRTTPGTLATVLRKHPVKWVDGCGEAAVRARYNTRRGVLLTVVDWAPDAIARPARGAPRVSLPTAVLGLLEEIALTTRHAFECAVIARGGALSRVATVPLDRLRRPLAVGCRYAVRPPAPSAFAVSS